MKVIKNYWINLSQGKKSAIVFTISLLIIRGLSIITTPIFTRIMSEAQIGIVGIYSAWSSMLGVLVSLGLTSGGFFIGLKDYSTTRNQYVSSILTLTTISAFVASGTFFCASNWWENIMGMPFGLIILMLLGFILTPAYEMWISRERYEYKYKIAGSVTVVSSVIGTIVSLLVVLHLKNIGSDELAQGRLYATYGINYIVYAVIYIYILSKGKTFFNKEYWTSALALSLPLVGHAFASQVLSVSDRMMIDKIIGANEVGLYTILYSVGTISLILWSSLNTTYAAYLFQNIDIPDRIKDIRKSSSKLILLFSCLVFIVALFAPEIVKLLATEQYVKHVAIVPPIVAGIYLSAIANMYSNILVYEKNTVMIMLSTCCAAGTNILLNYLWLPRYGFQVAAYTTMISYFVFVLMQALCSYWVYKKRTHLQFVYNNLNMILISATTICACLACILLYKLSIIRYFVVIIAILGALLIYKKYYVSKM